MPPTKGGAGYSNNGGANSGFQPGKSVFQHMVDGKENKTDSKALPEGMTEQQMEIMNDERYKNLDPRMVELIENEIMERQLDIGWNDIAGLEMAKKNINEIIIWPILRPDIFKGLRAPPRGVLFFGPPGTGKTLLGKAIAAQSKSTFMSISASTLTSKWVGEGEKMVRTMFAIAAVHQPTVIFIDEIDSLLCARSESDMESSRRLKTEFLVQLDGANTFAQENSRILIIGATNRPDDLDEAVKRRMAKRMYIPLPNFAGRKQFLQRTIERECKPPEQGGSGHTITLTEEELDTLVNLTKGYSGADLKTLCAEAAMIPLRSIEDIENVDIDNIRPLTLTDFKEAILNVKATVNQSELKKYLEWNDMNGSYPIREEDL